jgi:hypothetical protein
VIISPNDPGAMVQYAEECNAIGIRYIWDPGQQCARMTGDQLTDGITGATMVIVNDYEFELLGQKTGLREADILKEVEALVVTRASTAVPSCTRATAASRCPPSPRTALSIPPASATRSAAAS